VLVLANFNTVEVDVARKSKDLFIQPISSYTLVYVMLVTSNIKFSDCVTAPPFGLTEIIPDLRGYVLDALFAAKR
jgi:hypothetical protein